MPETETVHDQGGSVPPPSTEERDELVEALSAMLLEQRIVDFASELEDEERTILDRRVLSPRPESIDRLAENLGISRKRASTKVRDLEARFRAAVADPAH
jgi:DNA-directed RNA polymerase sigma subunit (sigma70/sigma32)